MVKSISMGSTLRLEVQSKYSGGILLKAHSYYVPVS